MQCQQYFPYSSPTAVQGAASSRYVPSRLRRFELTIAIFNNIGTTGSTPCHFTTSPYVLNCAFAPTTQSQLALRQPRCISTSFAPQVTHRGGKLPECTKVIPSCSMTKLFAGSQVARTKGRKTYVRQKSAFSHLLMSSQSLQSSFDRASPSSIAGCTSSPTRRI